MSPGTGRRYPLTMICEVWGVARSTVYLAQGQAQDGPTEPKKRGPKTELSDEALVEELRQALERGDVPSDVYQTVLEAYSTGLKDAIVATTTKMADGKLTDVTDVTSIDRVT